MNTVEIYNLKQLEDALKQEPKPTLEIKDPTIASAVRLFFRQRNSGFNTKSIIDDGCVKIPISPIVDLIITVLTIAVMILIDKYYINPEDKDKKWYDTLIDIFTFKYPYTETPSYSSFRQDNIILKPKQNQDV